MSIRSSLVKVPEITIFFWIIKALTTAFGESTSDFLVQAINPEIAVAIGGIAFVGALVLQFSVRRYIPFVYWFAVAMVAVFGTMAADVLHVGFGIPYIVTTVSFAIILLVIFVLWYVVEKTLSIHSIYTFRRELFYWATVMATFALGTAAGDLTASTLGLGYLTSGIVFAVLLLVVVGVHYIAKAVANAEHIRFRNEVIAFWVSYILTRPLGASFADWMGKASSSGGLGWGDGTVSLMLGILIVALVSYVALTGIDTSGSRVKNSNG
jgi:uncharacterized membrane-anchored protein